MKKLFGLILILTLSLSMSSPVETNENEISFTTQKSEIIKFDPIRKACNAAYQAEVDAAYAWYEFLMTNAYYPGAADDYAWELFNDLNTAYVNFYFCLGNPQITP